jgi:hypothetical protein
MTSVESRLKNLARDMGWEINKDKEPSTFDEKYEARMRWWLMAVFPFTRATFGLFRQVCCPDEKPTAGRCCFNILLVIFLIIAFNTALAIDIMILVFIPTSVLVVILPMSIVFGFAMLCSTSLREDTTRKFTYYFTTTVFIFIGILLVTALTSMAPMVIVFVLVLMIVVRQRQHRASELRRLEQHQTQYQSQRDQQLQLQQQQQQQQRQLQQQQQQQQQQHDQIPGYSQQGYSGYSHSHPQGYSYSSN